MALNSNANRGSKSMSPQRTARQSRVQQAELPVPILIKLVRLTICGLGLSAIIGTGMSGINPPHQNIVKKAAPIPFAAKVASLKLTQPSVKLNQQLQTKLLQTKNSATAKKTELDTSYIFVEIDSGE